MSLAAPVVGEIDQTVIENNLYNSKTSHVQYDDAVAVVRYVGGGYVRISSFFSKFSKFVKNIKLKFFLQL